MGAYQGKPVTDIETESGQGRNYEYASASMQGWRVRQEDAHICLTSFDEAKELSMFGVFDGHGGSEVAAYCAQKLAQHILANEHYLKGDLPKALSSSFLSFDLKLLEPDVQTCLNKLAGRNKPQEQEYIYTPIVDSDEEPEDINSMLEEATMPIEAILEKYKKRMETGEGSSDQDYSSDQDLYEWPAKTGGSSVEKGGTSVPVKDEKASPEKNGEHKSSKEVKDTSSGNSTSKVESSDSQQKSCEENGQAETKESTKDTPTSGGSSSGSGDSPEKIREKNGEAESKTKSLVVKEKSGKSSSKTTGTEKAILQLRSSERLKSALHHILENSNLTSSDEDDSDSDSEGDSCSDCSGISTASTVPLDSESEPESSVDEHEDDEDKTPRPYDQDLVGAALDSGTTAIVAILGADSVTVANVGDSRAIIGRALPPAPDAKPMIEAINLSFDHKPESQTEKTRIQEAGGFVDRDGRVMGGLNLSRALGDHSNKQRKDLPQEKQMISAEPDIKTQSILLSNPPGESTDKFLFLACDGIWNSLSSQDAAEFIWERMQAQMPITNILKEMFNSCLAKDTGGDGTGCDNMTAVLVRFTTKGEAYGDDHDTDTISWKSYDSDENEVDADDVNTGEVDADEVDADEEDKLIMPPPSKKIRLRRT